jgi:3-oxoacyl-[acyl-carrier protein] reductase
MSEPAERVAIVTGAAQGIGRATAEAFVAEGAAVVVADLNQDLAAEAAAELGRAGGRALAVGVDVARRASVAAMVEAALGRFGRVDVLVNNAGIAGRAAPLAEQTDEDWELMMAIDLKSVFLCSQAVLPHMLARGTGSIVNVASIAGKEGNPNMVPYSAAKAGVIGLTKALAKEVATRGIFVNAVAPAVIGTELLAQMEKSTVDLLVSKIPMGRVGRPEEVAALVAWLASEECSFSTGAVYDLSGGRATY